MENKNNKYSERGGNEIEGKVGEVEKVMKKKKSSKEKKKKIKRDKMKRSRKKRGSEGIGGEKQRK